MNNYTPLVISRNDKNKQLTLLSQRKLALTAINNFFALYKPKQPLPLDRPNSVNFCQHFFILSHEAVPLINVYRSSQQTPAKRIFKLTFSTHSAETN
jgi:hypothetical protein